jgi:hypothetical protein
VQVTFLHATSVHPEVLCFIVSSLVAAELYLLVTSLVLASAFHEVFECDFLAVCSPGSLGHGIRSP